MSWNTSILAPVAIGDLDDLSEAPPQLVRAASAPDPALRHVVAHALAEIADPVPGPDDVRIEIHAASLNPIDFKIVHGDLKRVSKYQLPRPFGFDASGVVTSVGRGASKFKPGDAVFVRASRDTSR